MIDKQRFWKKLQELFVARNMHGDSWEQQRAETGALWWDYFHQASEEAFCMAVDEFIRDDTKYFPTAGQFRKTLHSATHVIKSHQALPEHYESGLKQEFKRKMAQTMRYDITHRPKSHAPGYEDHIRKIKQKYRQLHEEYHISIGQEYEKWLNNMEA